MVDNDCADTVCEPVFCHLELVKSGFDSIFKVFQLADPSMRQCLSAAVLVENSVSLLSGTYGTGKTQLVELIKKTFFADRDGKYLFDYESCHQELTAFDVLYHLDLAALQQGKEMVYPKDMVAARLKFFNEIQRANTGFFNVLLPMLSEHRITYRDFVFEIPDFVCFMDRNPLDAGSSEIPEAFMDRIDFSFEIPAIHLAEHFELQSLRNKEEGVHWDGLESLTEAVVFFDQLVEVWTDVKKVAIPDRMILLSGMLSDAFRLCALCDRSGARLEFELDCSECQFQGELCSHLMKVPGQRLTNSLLRMSQALAWLDGNKKISSGHLLQALPWCFSHRLILRAEELRKKTNQQEWVRETALAEILRPKLSVWEQALTAYENQDADILEKIGENDLVVWQLRLMLQR